MAGIVVLAAAISTSLQLARDPKVGMLRLTSGLTAGNLARMLVANLVTVSMAVHALVAQLRIIVVDSGRAITNRS
jgi:hypothetical protein